MLKRAANTLLRPLIMRHMLSIAQVRPVEINIETTSICPSRCVFCPNGKAPKEKVTMDAGLFRKICEDYYALGGGAVGICSMQSDIFSDPLLPERVALLKQFRDRFSLHTATTLIGAAKLSDRELQAFLETFDFLDISIGGACQEDYQRMSGINAFDVVIDQLRRVEAIASRHGIAAEMAMNFRTNTPGKIAGSKIIASLGKTFAIREVRSDFFSWGGMITQADLPPGAVLMKTDNASARSDCVAPWATLCINADGAVVGCGCVDWQARHVIGDMHRQTITEVWGGKPAHAFRTSFSRHDIPELCRDCALYTDIERAFGRLGLINYRPQDGDYHKANLFRSLLQRKRRRRPQTGDACEPVTGLHR